MLSWKVGLFIRCAMKHVGVSFLLVFQDLLLLTKYGRVCFHVFSKKCYLRKYTVVGCKVYGDVWVHVYAFWVHVYGSIGCMCHQRRLQACNVVIHELPAIKELGLCRSGPA